MVASHRTRTSPDLSAAPVSAWYLRGTLLVSSLLVEEVLMLEPEPREEFRCPWCTGEVSLDPPYFNIGGQFYCSETCAKRGELVKARNDYQETYQQYSHLLG